jgi:hypothetical protein
MIIIYDDTIGGMRDWGIYDGSMRDWGIYNGGMGGYVLFVFR